MADHAEWQQKSERLSTPEWCRTGAKQKGAAE